MTAIPSLRDLASTPTARLLTDDGPGVAAWTVVHGRDLYVRSMPGGAPVAHGRARLLVGGAQHPVTLAEVAPEVHGPLDAAFRAKYGRRAPEKARALTSDAAAATTFRLDARRLTWAERVAAARVAVRDRRRFAGAGRTGRATGDEVPCVAC
ncbi:uncharacterized protein DUF2255 [Isoptericola jiangsuensis]|uniref:Uncharacterized protein DUF2255 n=1 Tax=Isoptericola jiangsuensis TaxID=548579 RepID=A0A2A9ESU1_9MICO|nr:DUF2255 family protein [Isoptericola jiangsuensis]PFG41601.1 uncharacterized protein DUF2255 [Isoptericola jiangsuensis]